MTPLNGFFVWRSLIVFDILIVELQNKLSVSTGWEVNVQSQYIYFTLSLLIDAGATKPIISLISIEPV